MNQCKQIPYQTQDIILESDKNKRQHHIQESQGVSSFPAGDHRAAVNKKDRMTYTKHTITKKDPQKKHRLERSVFFYWKA